MLGSMRARYATADGKNSMPGLILDLVIEILVRTVARAWQAFGTRAWGTFGGTVIGTKMTRGFTAIEIARITYSYQHGEGKYLATDSKPFWDGSSAKAYLSSHRVGSKLGVRVNPADPSESLFRESYSAELHA